MVDGGDGSVLFGMDALDMDLLDADDLAPDADPDVDFLFDVDEPAPEDDLDMEPPIDVDALLVELDMESGKTVAEMMRERHAPKYARLNARIQDKDSIVYKCLSALIDRYILVLPESVDEYLDAIDENFEIQHTINHLWQNEYADSDSDIIDLFKLESIKPITELFAPIRVLFFQLCLEMKKWPQAARDAILDRDVLQRAAERGVVGIAALLRLGENARDWHAQGMLSF